MAWLIIDTNGHEDEGQICICVTLKCEQTGEQKDDDFEFPIPAAGDIELTVVDGDRAVNIAVGPKDTIVRYHPGNGARLDEPRF